MARIAVIIVLLVAALLGVCEAQLVAVPVNASIARPIDTIIAIPPLTCCQLLTNRVNTLQTQVNTLLNRRSLVQAGTLSSGSYWAWYNYRTGTAATINRWVTFPIAYTSVPVVVTSIRGGDINKDRNLRISTEATSVSTTGFNLRIASWADTIVYSYDATWVATGK